MPFQALAISMTADEANPGPLEALLHFHLHRVSGEIRKDFEKSVALRDLRPTTLHALSVISANPGVRQSVVADVLQVQRTNVVGIIAELVEAGLVTREENASDRRAVALSITLHGSRILSSAVRQMQNEVGETLSRLTQHDRELLLGLLEKLEGGTRPEFDYRNGAHTERRQTGSPT